MGTLIWKRNDGHGFLYELFDGDKMVAWLQRRPNYCDRGHWQVNVDVPGLDSQDCFPRYYMRFETAQQETTEFIKWRLNRERVSESSYGS